MYNAWLADPASVHVVSSNDVKSACISLPKWHRISCLSFLYFQSWDAYFRNNSYSAPPSLAPLPRNHVPASQYAGGSLPAVGGGGALAGGRVDDKLIDDHLAVQAIIRSYQVKPHMTGKIVKSGKCRALATNGKKIHLTRKEPSCMNLFHAHSLCSILSLLIFPSRPLHSYR
jgi:hypothetical protein